MTITIPKSTQHPPQSWVANSNLDVLKVRVIHPVMDQRLT